MSEIKIPAEFFQTVSRRREIPKKIENAWKNIPLFTVASLPKQH